LKRHIFLTVFTLCSLGVFAQHSLDQNLKLKNLQGDVVLLNEVIKSDIPVIISFWATWCKPCLEELEAINEVKDLWQGKVRVVAVSIDDARANSKIKSLVHGKKWPFEVYLDSNKELVRALNIVSIPLSLIVDNTGKILYKHTGYIPGSEIELIEKAIPDGVK